MSVSAQKKTTTGTGQPPPPPPVPNPDIPLEVILSEKGKPMIAKSGYVYTFAKDGTNKKIWTCSKNCNCKNQPEGFEKCPVRLHTTDSFVNPIFLIETGDHNHPPDPVTIEIKRCMSRIKEEALMNLEEDEEEIITRNFGKVERFAQGSLPPRRNIKRHIKYLRTGKSKCTYINKIIDGDS